MTPQAYCRDKLLRSGSTFRHAFRGLPRAQREALEALYAYCREVDDAVDEPSDPAVAAARIAWWEEETDRLFLGTPRHPVTLALASVLERQPWSEADFRSMLLGMRADLNPQPPRDWAALEDYCDQVAGTVGRLSAQIFSAELFARTGASSSPADDHRRSSLLQYATHWGIALQLTNILRDVGEDYRRGRVYIPTELMAAHGAGRHNITQPQAERAVEACLLALAERARGHFRSALEHLPPAQRRAQRPGLTMGVIYQDLLDVLCEAPLLVLTHRVRLGPGRKLWLALLGWAGILPRMPRSLHPADQPRRLRQPNA